MCQGELLALRWQDLDLEQRAVTIRQAVDVRDGQPVLVRAKSVTAQRVLQLPPSPSVPLTWLAAGPPERMRDLTGHSELRVTEGYACASRESLHRDMTAIDTALGDESGHG